jgi:hypothetical protein
MNLLGSINQLKGQWHLLLILPGCKVLNGLFEMAFDFQSTDATTN